MLTLNGDLGRRMDAALEVCMKDSSCAFEYQHPTMELIDYDAIISGIRGRNDGTERQPNKNAGKLTRQVRLRKFAKWTMLYLV